MSQIFYSPSTLGFYDTDYHGERLSDSGAPNPNCLIPTDAVEISKARHSELFDAQARGGIIRPDADGYPEAFAPQAPSLEDLRRNMNVTTFQAHAAIHRSGLYNAVTELMNDPATDFEVKLAWDKAQHFSRLSPTVLAMGAALGLTDQQLDDLFTLAATIEA